MILNRNKPDEIDKTLCFSSVLGGAGDVARVDLLENGIQFLGVSTKKKLGMPRSHFFTFDPIPIYQHQNRSDFDTDSISIPIRYRSDPAPI